MSGTDYEIQPLHNQYAVYENDNLVANGFNDIESALHAIWVIEGKRKSEFFKMDKDSGVVFMVQVDDPIEQTEKILDGSRTH